MTRFREHPPLGFVLESWWFRALGDHYWVERLYSLTTAVVSGGLVVLLWRRLARDSSHVQACAWLPVLLWVLTSGWRGAYGNNILENTLGCFTLLAVYVSLRASEGRAALWLPLAAAAIVAAVFTKGPVALFPLATPAIAWLTLRDRGSVLSSDLVEEGVGSRFREWLSSAKRLNRAKPTPDPIPSRTAQHSRFARIVVLQLLLCALVAALVAAVLVNDDARRYMREYWQQQVVASLSGQREKVASSFGQFDVLISLATKLLLPVAIAVLSVAIARVRKLTVVSSAALGRPALFCLLTGLSASLPLAISPKQLSFYTAPSWPFYALALAFWCAPAMLGLVDWHYSTERAARRHFLWRGFAGAVAGTAIVVAVVVAGTAERDRAALADAAAIAEHVPPHTTLSLAPELGPSGALHAYLYRTHYISVSVDDINPPGRFRLETRKPATTSAVADATEQGVVLVTDRFVLSGPDAGEIVATTIHDRAGK